MGESGDMVWGGGGGGVWSVPRLGWPLGTQIGKFLALGEGRGWCKGYLPTYNIMSVTRI